MAVTLIERPADVSFSRNPIRYGLVTTTALDTVGLRVDVRLLWKSLTASSYTRTLEISLSPDSNGKASIDWQKVLDSLVENSLPALSGTAVSRAFEQVGMFYVEYREVTAASPSPSWTSDSANPRYCVKGGLPYERWQGPNFFLTYPNPFLTWQRDGRLIGPNEATWLTYLHTAADTTAVHAKIDIYFTDGTSVTNAIDMPFPDSTVVKNSIYRIPAGPVNAGVAAFDSTRVVDYYSVKVVNGAGNLHDPFTYNVDYRNTYSTTTFHWINSLGGMDSVRIRGDVAREAKYENQMSETTPDAGYFNESQLVPTVFTQQVLENITFKGSIGAMDDDRDIDRLRDLRISKGVFEAKFGRWWPVNLTNGTTALGTAADELKDYPLEWTYGFVNESYAPEDVTFSALPTCPVVTGITYDGTTLAWTGSGSHISYEIQIKKRSGTFVFGWTAYVTGTSYAVSDDAGLSVVTYTIRAHCGYNSSLWVP